MEIKDRKNFTQKVSFPRWPFPSKQYLVQILYSLNRKTDSLMKKRITKYLKEGRQRKARFIFIKKTYIK